MKFKDFLLEETDRVSPRSFRDFGEDREYMFFIEEHGPYTVRIDKEKEGYRVDFSYLANYTKGSGVNPMTVLKKVANRVKHHMKEKGVDKSEYTFPTVDPKRERVFKKYIDKNL
jgi:hypothetical protein